MTDGGENDSAPPAIVEAGEQPETSSKATGQPIPGLVPIPPPPRPLRKTKSSVAPGSKRVKPVKEVAIEEADIAQQYRQHYIALDSAYHRKLEMAKQRRESLMPRKKQTLTTPKTLAHNNESLIRATTPQWRHTWSNEDPHDVAGAQKQIEKTHDACKQQDMQMFKQDVERKRQEKQVKEKKIAEVQMSVMQQSLVSHQKERDIIEKVANRQLQMQQDRATRYMHHEARSKEYKEKLERERQEAIRQKAQQKEIRAEAARRRAEEENQRLAAKKMQLSMQQEMKRRALKGREQTLRQFEEKIQRNRVKSANMKNRIHQAKDEFEQQAQAKHNALLASLERSSKQKETLLDQRVTAAKTANLQKDARKDAKLKGIAAQQDQYCMHTIDKIMHSTDMLEKRKKEQEALRKDWLDGERARIYDDFMRKEVLIDTLNKKKIRDEYTEVWTSGYPIKECRPKPSVPTD